MREAKGRHCEPQAKQSRPAAHLDCRSALILRLSKDAPRNDIEKTNREGKYEKASCLHHGEQTDGTLFTGVTSNLVQRVRQHRESAIPGFTSRYGCKMLVWYELHDEMTAAIAREKQIKGSSRKLKLASNEAMNPAWRDLYDDLL